MKPFLLLASLVISNDCALHSLDYKETVVLRNYWKDNRLPLTREIATSPYEEGYEAYLPYNMIVKNQELYIFDMATPSFVKINESGQLLDTYTLESKKCQASAISDDGKVYLNCIADRRNTLVEYDLGTRNTKRLFPWDGAFDFFFDDETRLFYRFGLAKELIIYTLKGKRKEILIERILTQNKAYYAGENFVYRNIIYSPIDVIDERDGLITSGISKYEPRKNRIDYIKARGRNFRFVILGIDKNEKIYSAPDMEPTKIFVHDNQGVLLAEITPDYSKFGTVERGVGSDFLYIPFISEQGSIFLTIFTEEGLFIIKYSANSN